MRSCLVHVYSSCLLWLLCIGFSLGAFSPMVAQSSYSDFWKDHVRTFPLDSDSSFDAFSMLEDVVGDYQFFFTAEEHWKSVNAQIQFRFLTYLHQKAGVRNLILEGGYAYAELLNRYLETGKEKLLIRALYDTPVCPRNQMDFYRKLYRFNQSLPEAERVWLVGIDLEQSPYWLRSASIACSPTNLSQLVYASGSPNSEPSMNKKAIMKRKPENSIGNGIGNGWNAKEPTNDTGARSTGYSK